jgi:hypothetical protein
MTSLVTTEKQMSLPLVIEKEAEVDGIQMGVLSDGTAYLTARGLARMCGIDHTLIVRMAAAWADPKPRELKIQKNLKDNGIVMSKPYLEIKINRTTHYAFPDAVCMAVLEYYAFDAVALSNGKALDNFRLLAKRSFKEFIYSKVGYTPKVILPFAWQQFQDRVALNFDSVPRGYFSVFKEMASLIVTLIQSGADVGQHFIPDISVGQHWSKFWLEIGFETTFGPRKKYEHDYPKYFPQAASNPQFPYCYPDGGLGEFRKWFWENYVPQKLPTYLSDKVRQGQIPSTYASHVTAALAGSSVPKKVKSLQ